MIRTLKKTFSAAIAAGAFVCLHATAGAQTRVPTASVSANGVTLDVSRLFVQQGKLFVMPNQSLNVGGLNLTVGATGDPDPSIIYSFSANNTLSVATTFAFDIAIPLTTPVAAGDLISASVGYSLTDLAGDGVTLTPFPIAPYLSGFSQTVTGNGVDTGIDEGTGFTGSGGGAAFTYTTSFSRNGPSPFAFNVLDIHLSFRLSAGDAAGITGAVVTSAVPEPGSVALLVGLVTTGAGFLSRRRRQQARSAA